MFAVKRIPFDAIRNEALLNEKDKHYNSTPHYLYSNEYYHANSTRDLLRNWHDLCRNHLKTPCAWSFRLTKYEIDTIASSCLAGWSLGHRPRHLKEELEELEPRLQAEMDKFHPNTPWHIRMDSASPKDSGITKVINARDVITALSTSSRIYNNCIATKSDKIRSANNTVYFIPFDESWNTLNEWRVFVFRGEVRAISQYVWHDVSNTSHLTDNEILNIAKSIDQFTQQLYKLVSSTLGTSFVVDVYFDYRTDSTPKLIEFNSYMNSGSALFNWNRDSNLIPPINTESTTSSFTPEIRIVV
jgi:hypothetical protein